MAYQPNPNDPYRLSDDEIRRQARLNSLDNEIQPDPELGEGSASGAKVAMFAIAIAVVMGVVFYGLNNTSINQASTTPPAQTAQTQPANPPAAPPGMRDVTPRSNDQPGMTTGAAPARPATPPASTDMNKSANPPADAPASK
jgi:cell division protein FtsN